ncbi:PAAR domain-containing protein [Ralstonia flatus]|uniref:PAAR domain-containing protein n=1 Tax=Ralstonia flatus TaxID=3058601 RepID=A0AAD2C235_9RALS|nr:PAAR domain-containing protein [Ralstonia sp. LMG 32965]MBN6209092.1 PAAR domain-containing protein [Ralstonia pickettii]CAJ0890689.1 hypothetical protein R77567_04208 [Ralstonia sp. LMG 32965]CAJ0897218.1 hypothetical protein R77564_04074 [Ralstonia sp. LMG 32965]
MSAPIITVGDVGAHGSVVTTGSPTSKIRGRPIARLGDLVTCPIHGVNRIVNVSGSAKVGGEVMARAGDGTECGDILIGSQPGKA